MKHGILGFLVVALMGPGPPSLAENDAMHAKGHEHDFKDAEHWAKMFESEDRAVWQRPSDVLLFLGLSGTARAADIGAGTGYFTRLLAASLADGGHVYAVDIEQGMLDYMKKRDDFPSKDNITYVLADPDDPKLPDNELDLILIVNTWHHIEDRGAYLAKLERALRAPVGRVAIIDWHAHDLPMGPPVETKLHRDRVVAEFEKAGWRLDSESTALPYQYLLVFRP